MCFEIESSNCIDIGKKVGSICRFEIGRRDCIYIENNVLSLEKRIGSMCCVSLGKKLGSFFMDIGETTTLIVLTRMMTVKR